MSQGREARRSRLSDAKQELLRRRLRGGGAAAEGAVPLVARDAPLALSFAQERLWFLDRLGLGAAYNMTQVVRLCGPLDIEVLQASLDALVVRHEILRTCYPEHDGEPVQEVRALASVRIDRVDLRGATPQQQDEAVRRRWVEESRRPFDLTHGSPLRIALLRLGEDEHAFFIVLHHIAADDWSQQVLLGELLHIYRARRSGVEPRLPQLALQYADYAAWQRQRLPGGRLEEQSSYWTRQLADLAVLQLPLDRVRPSLQTFAGASRDFRVSSELSGHLLARAREHGVTAATLLMSVFCVLLSRYSGQRDIAVGSPVANRPRPELESLVGLFVSTVVMRADLSGDPRFADLLQQMHRTALEAQQNQDLPFERLVDALRPERDLSMNPLFQVLFAMMAEPGRVGPGEPSDERAETAAAGELVVRGYEVEAAITRFDLELNIRVLPEGIAGRFCFNTDLFDAATVERMAAHYGTLLAEVAARPTARLSELRLLGADERRRVLVEWNDTSRGGRDDVLVHELFERAAARYADRDAVVCGAETMTYRELEERASELARFLQHRGVGPETLVGVCMERGPGLVVAMLGVLEAGGAYVPLDPHYPQPRLAAILDDTAARLVLTDPVAAAALPAAGAEVVTLDAAAAEIADGSNGCVGRDRMTPDAPTHIIYTSGSTGRPKGVVITHRNVCALVRWAADVFDEQDLGGVLASTSVCFDLSVFEVFVPLCHGGTVVLADNLLSLPTLAGRDRVRLLNTVPSAAEELLEQDGLPASVRTVNLAGEPLKPALVDRLYDAGVERVFDLYGPSEATTYSTYVRRLRCGPETIGRPVGGEQAYILDEGGEPVPVGVVGELYLGGTGVARGYRNDAAATALRFLPDPFAGREGARLYRTGDLARYLRDGNIEFLGRVDHQVKVRGYRIEPGEVEVLLASHDGVRAAAVVPHAIGSADARLVGYVVAEAAGRLSTEELRAFLAERLPRYMVPDTLMLLDALPRTPNGKLDRKALPALELAQPARVQYAAPESPLEEELVALWEETLRVERVGIHDNFFDRGGHSLLATRLLSRVRGRFEIDLPLRAVFLAPTVAGMASELVEAMLEQEDPDGVGGASA